MLLVDVKHAQPHKVCALTLSSPAVYGNATRNVSRILRHTRLRLEEDIIYLLECVMD